MNETEMEREENRDFEYYLRKKEKELEGELSKLETAFAFFRWWRQTPNGGRVIYAEHRAFDMFEDVKKEKEKKIEDTLSYDAKDFALKIDDFRYLVISVKRKPTESVRKWSVDPVELPAAFRD